jgi:hypothetical protein
MDWKGWAFRWWGEGTVKSEGRVNMRVEGLGDVGGDDEEG